MTTMLPPAESAVVDQTRILKAFCALMSGENGACGYDANAALDVLAEAAREGKILAAVKTIAEG